MSTTKAKTGHQHASTRAQVDIGLRSESLPPNGPDDTLLPRDG
jgi:hypothetical protein